MRSFVLFACSLLVLSACSDHALPPPPAPLQFVGVPYHFNAARVEVNEDYVAKRRPPYVDYLTDIPPDKAVRQWAAQQVVAAGAAGRLEINIKDASITEKDLPKQKHGIEGWFTKEQTEQYDGTIDMEIKLYSPRRVLPVARAEAVVHRSNTLREDATAIDRSNLYHQMTIDLMQALQVELDKNIRMYFANYLM